MKITDMKATPIALPFKEGGVVSGTRQGPPVQTFTILEVFTDEGITGIAEVPTVVGATASANLVLSAKPFFVGKDPTDVNVLLKQIYSLYNLYHFHIHAGNWALNSVERALWDIVGQKTGLPIFRLWGGAFRKKIPVFAFVTPNLGDLDKMKEQSAQFAAKGYTVLYTKVGLGSEEDDINMVRAMREGAKDPAVKLRVDPNQGWSVPRAVSTINKMEPYGMDCVDQPIQMHNLDGLKTIKRNTTVPIAAHEASWTMYEMLRLIKEGAADIVHIDNRFDHGVYGARISAGMCEAAGVPAISHAFNETGIAIMERMHMIASCPAFTMVHQIPEYEVLADDVIRGGKIPIVDGCVQVTEAPGLGLSLDQDKLAKYHEYYVKEVWEAGFENTLDDPIYNSMYTREYLSSVQ